MLTIARTLIGNSLALLLDEPSEGLAPVIVEQLASTVLELKENGLTILLSEQNLRFAGVVADRALIIERGRIAIPARSPSWPLTSGFARPTWPCSLKRARRCGLGDDVSPRAASSIGYLRTILYRGAIPRAGNQP
jgi:energy-coupling factor transporter ATP-binding protein EcfA2